MTVYNERGWDGDGDARIDRQDGYLYRREND
jgi:hypothetical protein